MNEMNNSVYVFVPFRDRTRKIGQIHTSVLESGAWTQVKDEVKYMLRYVTDKLDGHDAEGCRYFHYKLTDAARAENVFLNHGTVLQTAAYAFEGEQVRFAFSVADVQMFMFGMGIGMLAFRLQFHSRVCSYVSTALYYLKKVSRERVYIYGAADDTSTTLLDLAKAVLLPVGEGFEYFFYANEGTERANIFLLMEAEPGADYKRELYFLRRCYSNGFKYRPNPEAEARELYSPSGDQHWGISQEATACLIYPDGGRAEFLRGTFTKNFNEQYLFMYVLLLHQKYMLYHLQTQIGTKLRNDLTTLEAYRRMLYEFETDFVFTCVTEVEQYQTLYEDMMDVFALKDMFADVRDPLNSLSEIRQKEEEEARKKNGKRLNVALALLSLLSVFSAAPDSWALAKHIAKAFFDGRGAKVILAVFICLIVGVFAWVLLNLRGDTED